MTNLNHDSASYLPPWRPVTEYADNLEHELWREVSEGHPLFEIRSKAIAQRLDSDDVLFKVDMAQFGYAAVHLTWSQRREMDPRWPATDFYRTFDDWLESRMKPDNVAFSEESG
jgi:hypothetical protein